MIKRTFYLILLAVSPLLAQKDISTYKWRSIGPAFMSGRIVDLAVDPVESSTYYVAVASGGVLKTTNGGTTYQHIFEKYGSYAIGCVSLDPQNRHVVWVGTGEANNQRSVGYGDGVYKSEDGGKSFKNMGLKASNHIGEILVHPANSNVIYVAAYGPLWSSGGERGVYKSTDGGVTWTQVLSISEHTGVADLAMDPRNPDVLYASAHQRQRKGYGYVSGGPESGLYKTEDGGATWKEINNGLPSGDKGRHAIAISPINPDVLYCHVEAAEGKSGSYKSTDRGASWVKLSSYTSSGLYYGKIFPDPVQFDRIFVGDVFAKVSKDGGKTYESLNMKNVHVDNHTFWIDPKNNQHWMMGGDGGLYETWDEAETWHFKPNMSLTQFYRVATDNDSPFYNVYGGTQDNSSLGGPSRTINSAGIPNSDWFLTNGGDGFESQVDWSNPNIVYAQAQHGWLVRYDKKSGERVMIKPVELEGEPALRWNWDSPLRVSKHDPKRLYFGANKLYRSDNYGNDWTLISPDLSRQMDRNKLPYMGKIWSVDAVQKNTSTSIWGSLTALDESSLDENLILAGTDDGLIQITKDGGATWTKIDEIKGAPEMSYIPQLITSQHDKEVAYVVFNHHRYGDYKPYLFKTIDGGKSWKSVVGDLPERGSLYTIAEDHVDPNLLFLGSDFGAYVSQNGGENWVQLKAGLPTIAVKDIEIQRRENDVVIATFGRGFYVLDDYSNLRETAKHSDENYIYATKDTWMFQEASPLGGGRRSPFGTQGDSFYAGENPEYGAVVRYQVKEVPKSMKALRQEREKKDASYPPLDSLLAEDMEIMPYHLLVVQDEDGETVYQEKVKPSKGLNKWVWDLSTTNGYSLNTKNNSGANSGLPVLPGKYKVTMQFFDGVALQTLASGAFFEVKSLGWSTLPATSLKEVKAFAVGAASFAKVVYGTAEHVGYLEEKLAALKAANLSLKQNKAAELWQIEKEMQKVRLALDGNASLEKRQFETLPGIRSRVSSALWSALGHSSEVPGMQKKSLELAKKEFTPVYAKVKDLDERLNTIQKSLETAGSPYIQGSLPKWEE